jgi:hypothetical protein
LLKKSRVRNKEELCDKMTPTVRGFNVSLDGIKVPGTYISIDQCQGAVLVTKP